MLVAFGAYVHRLDARALWWDEGFAPYYAQLPARQFLSTYTAANDHPPAYYLAAAAWSRAAGASPFSLRLFSALSAVLLIPLLYVLGRRMGNPIPRASSLPERSPAGWGSQPPPWLAAVLAAASPFIFHHARDIHMYGLGLALAAAAAYAFLRVLPAPRGLRWWLLYVASLTLGLYTQYAFAIVPLAQGAAVLVDWRRQERRRRRWLAAAAAVVILFGAWVLFAWPQIRRLLTGRAGGEAGAWSATLPVVVELLGGGGGSMAWLAAGLVIALALVGLARLAPRWPAAAVFVGLASAAGLLAAGLVRYATETGELVRTPRPAFAAVPLILAAAAVGLSRLGHLRLTGRGRTLSRLAGLIALVVIAAQATRGALADYAYRGDPQEDYRPLVATLRALARPGDAALTAYAWQDGYLASYAPGLPVTLYRNAFAAGAVADLVEPVFAAHSRLWLVNYRTDAEDTGNPLHAWLSQNAALALAEWVGRSQLALFVRPGPPPADWNGSARFEQGITLEYAVWQRQARPGEILAVDLRWQASAPLDRDYRVFVHLRPGAEAPPLAQTDRQPAGGLAPSSRWLAGQPVLDRRALLIPMEAAPGTYTLYVGLYDPASGARLAVPAPAGCDTADSACLGSVSVR